MSSTTHLFGEGEDSIGIFVVRGDTFCLGFLVSGGWKRKANKLELVKLKKGGYHKFTSAHYFLVYGFPDIGIMFWEKSITISDNDLGLLFRDRNYLGHPVIS